MTKLRVGILFGGRSGEHDVSIASAIAVMRAIDRGKYDPVPIGITRQGEWHIFDSPDRLLGGEIVLELAGNQEAVPDLTHHGIVPVTGTELTGAHESAVDVVFPLLHGPYGEDGTVQGLLEMANLPYIGAGVFASAASMDKGHMKSLFAQAGIPSVPYIVVARRQWRCDRETVIASIEDLLEYPVFVKPCNMGSSVGISKARNRSELEHSLDLAAAFDRRLIVELGINAREVECAVLGNDDPVVSVPGEIIPHHDFYDYEAKYTEGLADLLIPAQLSNEQQEKVRDLARKAFLAVEAAGLARVDFFVRRSDGEVIVNEINTMPGFTSTSMYPRLWEHSGIPYPDLIDRLIQLALERHQDNQNRSVTR